MTMDDLNLHARGGLLRFSDSLDNPNRMPFTGVLTYLGVPSDQPPGGSGGMKVMIPVDVGETALPSLKGMPVNLAASMDDHDTSAVVGHIEEAWLGEPDARGAVPVHVSGIVYAKSFPDEAREIKAQKERLGFSYETSKTSLTAGIHNGEKVAIAESLVFTGAAILYKQSAAYQTTSLAASADAKALAAEIVEEMRKFNNADVTAKQEDVNVEENKVTAPAVTEVKVEGINELSAAMAQLIQVSTQTAQAVQALTAKMDEKETKEAEVAAAAATVVPEPAPTRTTLTGAQLSAKFDKDTNGADLVASIDAKNLDTTASMAAKLALLAE